MDEASLSTQLVREGFSHTDVWEDAPNARYQDHTHGVETAHIILSGEMTLMMHSVSRTYREGERCDVPARAVPKGRRFLSGEH